MRPQDKSQPTSAARIERRDGPTPSGGAYSEAIFDEGGNVVEIHEYDASGESIARTYFDTRNVEVER